MKHNCRIFHSLLIVGIVLGWHVSSAHSFAFESTRRYAIIVGNNVGQGGDEELRYAQNDVIRFSSVMRRHGGLVAENTIQLLGDSAAAIRRAIQELNARIRVENNRNSQPSLLIVYYSGHADAEGLHPGKESLSYDELTVLLRGSAATVRLLILDGCRSGGITKVKGGAPAKEFELSAKSHETAEGLVMISSSAAGEDSHESDELRASFFSHHFINGLSGAADVDADSIVSLREAYSYAYRNTLRTSGRGFQLQHPTYKYELKGRDEIVMTDLNKASQAAQLRLGEPGEYLIRDESEGGKTVAELNVVQKNALLAIPVGDYFVQFRKPDHYREFQVRVKRGEIATIDTKKGRRIAYARLVRKGAKFRHISHQVHSRLGMRGGLLIGEQASPSAVLGYQLDLPHASFGIRARFSQPSSMALYDDLQLRQHEWAFGGTVKHFFDFELISVGVGVMAEVIQFRQGFSGSSSVMTRNSFGFSYGGLVSVERPVLERLLVTAEFGPMNYLIKKGRTELGEEIGTEWGSILTGWFSLGIGVLF